jgi:hypothetical protein
MRIALVSILILLIYSFDGHAAEFTDPRDHCAAREYSVTHPRSGSSGILFGTSAWAEAGLCLRFPIERLRQAAGNVDVMTFPGTTRVVDVESLPLQSPDQLMHLRIDDEARHEHLFICQGALWPMEWIATIRHGSGSDPEAIVVTAERIAGGDSNGGYIKHWSVRAELQRVSANETSFHMRYEITAPGQDSDWAVDAITGYIDRLTVVASGGKAAGAETDPDCPG